MSKATPQRTTGPASSFRQTLRAATFRRQTGREIFLLFACLFAARVGSVQAQAVPTATKSGGLQVGAGYVRANPDYSPKNFNGFAVYSDVDLWKHFGAEAEFHRIAVSTDVKISETSYEVGGRYRLPIGPLSPYLKLMVGAGSFRFENSTQNGTHGMFAGGGGIDFRIHPRVMLRADYEYQRWASFPPRGLQPSLVTIGIAYAFK